MFPAPAFRKAIALLAVLAGCFSLPRPLFAERLLINELMSNNQSCCADRYGQFDDWIEIHNAGGRAVNIGGMFITDDLTDPGAFQFPTDDRKATTIPAGGYILLWADEDHDQPGFHLNFGLSSNGEQLGLFASDGTTLVDSVTFGPLRPDVSYARVPDGKGWFLVDEPSPGRKNDSSGKRRHSQAPSYSHESGRYDYPFTVILSHPDPKTRIFFSTDGSIPTGKKRYDGIGVRIETTTVLRSVAVAKGLLPSDVMTRTYFVGDEVSLPTVSLAVDPEHLWGDKLGIYVEGDRRNFTRDWERPAHIEFYDVAGGLEFSQDVGVKLHGGWSRNQPQKSIAVRARRGYGNEAIYYPLFPDKPLTRYKGFVLRNSGNDWTYTLLRDAIMQALVKGRMDIDYQAYRPVVLFLNGQYWGIHNMRERISVDYLTDNHGFGSDEIDYLVNDSEARAGDAEHYQSFLSFFESSDLQEAGAIEEIRASMDLDEFLNYQIAEIYSVNTDWPGNNWEFWRPRSADGRWRWIFFDLDYGFNLPLALNPSPPELDMVAWATTPGEDWWNPPWATFLMQRLLEIDEVRQDFIQRFASHLNTTFERTRVEAVIDSMRNAVAEEIPRHSERWAPYPSPSYGNAFASIEEWDANLEVMRSFARVRAGHVWGHLQNKFSLGGRSTLSLEVEPEGAGTVFVNTVPVTVSRSSGLHFNGVPIDVAAVPAPGFEFDSWSDPVSDTSQARITIEENYGLAARFTSSEQEPVSPRELPVVINEINYNSGEALDSGDWVELHNHGSVPVEIGGWRFRDAGNSPDFILPPDVLLEAGGYVVLCRDSTDFRRAFPETDGCLGDFPFGLSSRGDHITLLTGLERVVDSVVYDERPPWPTEPNGTGFTLALIEPTADNSRHENWYASPDGGTPGVWNAPATPSASNPGVRAVSYPNPFYTSATVFLSLSRTSNVSVQVFNLLGAHVATLVDDEIMEAAEHSLVWDGRSAAGHEVASGVYLCRITINGFPMTRKMLKVARNR